jgi:hypothetical protein
MLWIAKNRESRVPFRVTKPGTHRRKLGGSSSGWIAAGTLFLAVRKDLWQRTATARAT